MRPDNESTQASSSTLLLACSAALAGFLHAFLALLIGLTGFQFNPNEQTTRSQPFPLKPLRYITTSYPGPSEEEGPTQIRLPSLSHSLQSVGFRGIGRDQCDPDLILLQSSLFAEGVGWRPDNMVLLDRWEQPRIYQPSLDRIIRKMPGDLRAAAREAILDFQEVSMPGTIPACLAESIDAKLASVAQLQKTQAINNTRFVDSIASSYPPHCGYFSVSHLGFSHDARVLVLFRHWYGCQKGAAAMEFWTRYGDIVYRIYGAPYPRAPVA